MDIRVNVRDVGSKKITDGSVKRGWAVFSGGASRSFRYFFLRPGIGKVSGRIREFPRTTSLVIRAGRGAYARAPGRVVVKFAPEIPEELGRFRGVDGGACVRIT